MKMSLGVLLRFFVPDPHLFVLRFKQFSSVWTDSKVEGKRLGLDLAGVSVTQSGGHATKAP